MAAKRDNFLRHLERLNNRQTLEPEEYKKLMETYICDSFEPVEADRTFDRMDEQIILRAIQRDRQAAQAYQDAQVEASILT